MNADPDRFWKEMALTMQRAKGLHQPTADEAEQELESVEEAPFSATPAEIDSLVASAAYAYAYAYALAARDALNDARDALNDARDTRDAEREAR